MPFCPNCGREVSEDALVCPYCGKKLGTELVPAEKRAAKQVSGLELAGWVLGAVGIVVMIGAGISMAAAGRWIASAEDLVAGMGTGFIGLGLFFAGILCLLFTMRSRP